MSKQSDAKEKQGFSKTPNTCSNCINFRSEKYKEGYAGRVYDVEKELRCAIGGFKVNKTNTCDLHILKEIE